MQNPAQTCLPVLALSALLAACGGGGGGGGTAEPDLLVANAAGPWADALVPCVTAEFTSQSCTMAELPLLGQQTLLPSIDDIMNRVVVSDEWMATRFRAYLQQLPAEARRLFVPLTAIVIAGDIRPSFYTTLTGAIYLDPQHLWLTNAEKTTISAVPDFRAGYGSDLDFVSLARYVDGNDYAWDYYPLSGTATRTLADIVRPLSATLFHELGHANDFFPRASLATLDRNLRVVAAAELLLPNTTSELLYASLPLTSSLWFDLAEVLYIGLPSTAAQRALTPGEVGIEFQNDGASDDYAYAYIYEDTAMLFEESLMRYFFGIEREVAYTDAPALGLEQFCDQYVIRWGYRNRISEPLVRARAELVLQSLLDEPDVSAYLSGWAAPQALTNGSDWCTVQALAAPLRAGATAVDNSGLLRPDDRREGLPH